MLNAAGVGAGGFGGHAQSHQQIAQNTVALIDTSGNFQAFRCQGEQPVGVCFHVAVFPQLFHGDGNAGFGKVQHIGHVNGTDMTVLFLQHQYGFQIIFCRFVNMHHSVSPFAEFPCLHYFY